jgi:hypothetical protein
MVSLARVIHSLPGWKRAKIDEKREDEVYFTAREKDLADCPDILTVEANHLTDTVLVRDRANDPDFSRCALEWNLFRLDQNLPASHPIPPAVPVSTHPRGAKRETNPGSSNGLNMRFPVFLGMTGMGIFCAIGGNIVIPSIAAFWYAFSVGK